jgi:leucyl aminopeptidase
VTATVWAYSSFTSDALDIYYTANANSPTWTLIGTIVPTASGAQTLSSTFTLPTGALQAVRANFRYQGSASSCSAGAYDDHDDLIFAVN